MHPIAHQAARRVPRRFADAACMKQTTDVYATRGISLGWHYATMHIAEADAQELF